MVNKNISEDEQLLKQFYSRYGGYWRFPDMLDHCYLVNPYFNRSAIIIIKEMQDFFPVLVSEYPSGMVVNFGLASECWGSSTFCSGSNDSSREGKSKPAKIL
ncbi:MAG: hypothetical protein Q4F34_00850 [Prevotellaceae bacterium]|nr:hypothetical protein [Prevotellaceae bacterium]